MTKLPADAWVMVGDGEKALFLKNEGDEVYPNLVVVRTMEQSNPSTREQGTDAPGRLKDGPGHHSSAVEEADWHRLEKERFAKDIAERLYKAAHKGQYRHLVVAAPPQVLGELRKALHKEVSERILFDVPKELTNHPVNEIEKALTSH
ncbi:host attachment family protein [Acuticoccus sp. M5D2P5]|uniref:baeRF12 domain-containing protein n=1 Tax=Acuticoccus kalidii TaxID=2910977 RepID=UPI001F21E971|nr:host attachment family protein [Acuticoccus kalidii]MCF3935613.1 host attachment family protein [Acuticoccus kalidii]